MTLYSKNIVTPNGVLEGYLTMCDGKIQSISKDYQGEYIDYADAIIMPGYIDLHIHGWATGSYWMEKTPESIWEMQTHLPKVGVTSFLATTGADSIENTFAYIQAGNEVYQNQKPGAELLGIHMEGPFISKEYKGLQKEEHCIHPDVTLMKQFYEASDNKSLIKLMTLAPELPNAKELIEFNRAHHIQNSIGHSGASFETVKEMKPYGLGGVTHMFSGMKGFHHRELGVVGAALYFEDLLCEFAKQSGMTVKHEAFDFVFRLKGSDGIFLSTDCQGLARTQSSFYHYIRKETFTAENGKLKVTTDAGETKYLDPDNYEDVENLEISYAQSIQNMMKHTKMTLVELSKITSLNPAKYISVDDKKGSIEIGKDADIVVLDKNYHVQKTYCKGTAF